MNASAEPSPQERESAARTPAASSAPGLVEGPLTDSPEPAVASDATLRALELPGLLAVLAELAATDLGTERVLASRPFADRADLETHRARYEDASRLTAERRLVGSFDFPLGALLDDLASGRPASPGLALVRLRDLLTAGEEARDRLLAVGPGGERRTPALAALVRELGDGKELARRIGKALDSRGQVREDASPRLSSLRGRIRSTRDSLYSELKGLVETNREHLSEETIPLRGGRLVMMLSSGARGRVPGLVHGRSATGKSFYFEPLSVVESNNELQQAVEDEEAEKNRILAELLTEARRLLPTIEDHAYLLAELDAFQAAHRFAERTDGRLAELAPRGTLTLAAARHPLIDPALSDLRRAALGQAGHQGEVVPMDLSLSPENRALVVTGPNAGGKTVTLKTVGLLTLAHLCGLPVPAAAGSALPHLESLVATVGDEQDLLADRSTFSGRLIRLKEAWEAAGPDSLVLLDELGSGTDPEEGAALSISLLEGLMETRTLALITTHLTPLAAAALEMPEATCAAMQFDPGTGEPTYRLLPGPPGGSEALSLARRLGLPGEWLDRAEGRLGSEHRDLRRLLAELEQVRADLSAEQDRFEAQNRELELLRARLARQEEALEEEQKTVGRRLRGELESFRGEVRRKLRDELEKIQEELKKGRKKGLAREAEERLFAEAPELAEEEPEDEAPLEEGGRVRHKGLGWEGVLENLSGDRAEVYVSGKRVRCRVDELIGLAEKKKKKRGAGSGGVKGVAGVRGVRVPGVTVASAGAGGGGGGDTAEAAAELNLIGKRVEPALEELDAYLDQVLLSGRREVRLIHGHGTGRLRDAVRDHLRRHPGVKSSRQGAPNEGGNGATVVSLRE